MEEQDHVVSLIDEEGNEHQFIVVDVFLVEENQYVVLVPFASEEGEDEESESGGEEEAFIFRLAEKDGEQALEEIEAEEEWQRVAEAWEARLQEMEEQEDQPEE